MTRLLWTLAVLPLAIQNALAATAEQWRGRSIYQIITDRFALAEGADLNACDPGDKTYCGGTWNSIRENLDYIQDAGFTAIWISPVNQNYDGPATDYGDPYHGYWMKDVTKLNDRFGDENDLHALVEEVHKRKMYIMVDIVVNNVMATSTNPDYSDYLFKDAAYYHPYCGIEWGNTQSEQNCWMGDSKVPLPDVDTSNPDVVSVYTRWIKDFVATYSIDGLRIDAAKHVNKDFWPQFCGAAGVFCIGEVFGDAAVEPVAQWQGADALDSVLNFPMYSALVSAFQIPGPNNVSMISSVLEESKAKFTDLTVLGNFLENQDLPRWSNLSVDPQAMYNAMTWTFMSDGIPIVYAGQEQYFHGAGDPYNREPLWPSNYANTTARQLISELNVVRNFLVSNDSDVDWVTAPTVIKTESDVGIAFEKGPVITVLTTIGSPGRNATNIVVQTDYPSETLFFEVTSGGFGDGRCIQWVVGSEGHLEVEYTKGGRPRVFVLGTVLENSHICHEEVSWAIVHEGLKSAAAPIQASLVAGAVGLFAAWMSIQY
ncbi:glycoside hydrolase family 13 protein [Cylindrobasidium torrendii FP15055 ss-10]|uniref:alpha-amylase n=1 Tax=Cylindrobasidium torrendii FP15055 ss-10 TaxID=1314674 RepID=A0A0D7BEI6_9AGAR|nr:glycoside hydrolase family 13 protein [Cylindrobasidium torrendii FP15055 ss-10]